MGALAGFFIYFEAVMGMPSFGELVIILLIVLLVFGAGKLPQIGDALGRSIKNFKKATANDEIDVTPGRESLPDGERTAGKAPAERESANKA